MASKSTRGTGTLPFLSGTLVDNGSGLLVRVGETLILRSAGFMVGYGGYLCALPAQSSEVGIWHVTARMRESEEVLRTDGVAHAVTGLSVMM